MKTYRIIVEGEGDTGLEVSALDFNSAKEKAEAIVRTGEWDTGNVVNVILEDQEGVRDSFEFTV